MLWLLQSAAVRPIATSTPSRQPRSGYSHWQKKHSSNRAASVLEARWRLANELTDHGKRQLLNLKAPLPPCPQQPAHPSTCRPQPRPPAPHRHRLPLCRCIARNFYLTPRFRSSSPLRRWSTSEGLWRATSRCARPCRAPLTSSIASTSTRPSTRRGSRLWARSDCAVRRAEGAERGGYTTSPERASRREARLRHRGAEGARPGLRRNCREC